MNKIILILSFLFSINTYSNDIDGFRSVSKGSFNSNIDATEIVSAKHFRTLSGEGGLVSVIETSGYAHYVEPAGPQNKLHIIVFNSNAVDNIYLTKTNNFYNLEEVKLDQNRESLIVNVKEFDKDIASGRIFKTVTYKVPLKL